MLEDKFTQPMSRSFYEDRPEKVAQSLLGKFLIRKIGEDFLIGRIVEVEAYLPENDLAAHNKKGKTERTKSLFNEAGHAYVHAMRHHHLLDIVTEGIGVPGSVLIRALEPVMGEKIMMENRKTDDRKNLTNGPGKICQALQISRKEDGIDMTDTEFGLYVCSAHDDIDSDLQISNSGRVGISASEDLMLRYFLKDNPFVSGKNKATNPK